MKEIIKFAIVGVIMAVFIVFLAFFAIQEDNFVGNGQQKQNISEATGNIGLPFIENMIHHQDAVDMVNTVLTKKNILKLDNK
ncbi:hypothetical protein [Methanobacterium sp.]|uniref:hypothetical protein n=1 Tax=Methanobacterium sp. TaxID=2164 RepID=UPI003C7416AC